MLIDWRSGWLEVVFEAWQEPGRWLHLGGERCGDVWGGRPIQEPERWLQAESERCDGGVWEAHGGRLPSRAEVLAAVPLIPRLCR